MKNELNSFILPTMIGGSFSKETVKIAKGMHQYSEMIVSKNYPPQINSFQQNEINSLWERGATMAAVKKLQDLLTPQKPGKTLL